jgi:stage II sporulation protein Q
VVHLLECNLPIFEIFVTDVTPKAYKCRENWREWLTEVITMDQKNKEKEKQETLETQPAGEPAGAPENNSPEQASPAVPSRLRALLAKRWAFPVLYMGAAVLIIGLMYAKGASVFTHPESGNPSGAGGQTADSGQTLETAASQQVVLPLGDDAAGAQVVKGFFDEKASKDLQANALVKYDNIFYPHEGVDWATPDHKAFTVVAAAAGKVTQVTNDPLMGNVVQIAGDNGYVYYYASLADVQVKEGQVVQPGQPIAKAGIDRYESGENVHLHFEVKKDGQDVNPMTILPKNDTGKTASTSAGAGPSDNGSGSGADNSASGN